MEHVRHPILSRILLVTTLALVVLPVLVDLSGSDRFRPFGYLAADAFYYLTVGRNLAETGRTTFDQRHETNGFHPLWQVLTGGMFVLLPRLGVGEPGLLRGTLLFGLLLLTAGIALLLRAMADRETGSSPMIVTLPVGAYAVILLPIWAGWLTDLSLRVPTEGTLPLYGTLWSHVNGMESALVIFMLGVTADRFIRGKIVHSPSAAAGFGALLGLLTLARLDHGFFAVALIAVLGVESARSREARARILVVMGVFFAVVGGYLLFKELRYGAAFPTSGALKSTFPHPRPENFADLGRLLRGEAGDRIALVIRHAQMDLPVAVALVHLALAAVVGVRRKREEISRNAARVDRFLVALAFGVLLLGAYNFLFVRSVQQWHWYYPVSTLFVGLVAVRWLDRFVRGWARTPVGASVWIGGWCVASISVFLAFHRPPDYHAKYARFYYELAPRVREHYGEERPGLLSFDDGIVAFSTRFPTMSGKGLNLDPIAARERREGRLLELALARGYDRITSLVYLEHWGRADFRRDPAGAADRFARFALKKNYREGYRFVSELHEPDEGFVILRVERED
jgi:hypothetical protein